MGLHVIIGSGPVGSATAATLDAAGHQVRLLSRSGSGPNCHAIEQVAVDASDATALGPWAAGADALYNCANPAYHRWEHDWPPIAAAMLDVAARTGATLVTMSNLYGYGPAPMPLRPDLPLSATGRKGRVRAAMWRNALAAHESGRVRVTEARASDFFGPGLTHQSQLGSRVMPRLLRGKAVQFLGNPNLAHSLSYIADVGRTLATLGTDERAAGRAWHVPSVVDASYADAVRRLAALAGIDTPKIGTLPPALLRIAGVFSPTVRELQEVRYQFEAPFTIDASETTAVFGNEATPFDEALAATLAWWQERVASPAQPRNSPPLTSSV